MESKISVLIFESDKSMQKFFTSLFKAVGYTPIFAETYSEAAREAASYAPELLILDTDTNENSSEELISHIRLFSDLPIVVISSNLKEAEKIRLFDAGADDCIIKPLPGGELLARIRAILRRCGKQSDSAKHTYKSGELEIDFDKYAVFSSGKEIHLTNNEFKIVCLLARNAGKVMTYDGILKSIWGQFVREDNKILRVNMTNIRRKIEKNPAFPEYFLTVPGVGYKIREED